MSEEDKDARQGWRARRRGSRERITRRQTPEDRQLANAARAELLGKLREDREFNSEVGGEQAADAGAGSDYVSDMSDEDLAALYEQLTGKPPHHKAKRAGIERAVRKAQADREEAAKLADDVGDDLVEGDDQ